MMRARGLTVQVTTSVENSLIDGKRRVSKCGEGCEVVSCAEPQGSVLERLIFKIHINDLDNGVKKRIS